MEAGFGYLQGKGPEELGPDLRQAAILPSLLGHALQTTRPHPFAAGLPGTPHVVGQPREIAVPQGDLRPTPNAPRPGRCPRWIAGRLVGKLTVRPVQGVSEPASGMQARRYPSLAGSPCLLTWSIHTTSLPSFHELWGIQPFMQSFRQPRVGSRFQMVEASLPPAWSS